MKRYQITLNGRTFDVRLLSDPRQEQVQVEVNGEQFTVDVETMLVMEEDAKAVPTPAAASTITAEVVAPSAGMVSAPLPGVIKSIAVQPGQHVATGDELLVIEAMKMDNAIRASREGVISTIFVTEGRQVAHGEPMLEYSE